jgi:scyllo-inositol 2-dehydrogenase (NADP+)
MHSIKTALLSYGMSGKVFHAPFLELHPGFELTGSWERSKQLIQQDYPLVKSYKSLDEILQSDAELVIVNTPVATHFDYAKQVLLAGKHALVEKAFTTTAAEAEELDAIAKEKGLKLCVFQNRRWDSDLKTVKQVLDDNLLGDIVEAEFRFDRYNPQLSPKVHKETANPGAGVLKDLGPHLIDQALYLFGFPDAVFADIRTIREHSVVDDGIDILMYYPHMRVRIRGGFFFREPVPAYALHGRKGSFLKSRGDVQEDELKAGRKPNFHNWGVEKPGNEGILHTEKDGDIFRGHIPTLPGNYYDLFDGLHKAIIEDKEVPVSAQDGIRTMKIIDAAQQSSREKRIIQL